ncbi:2OG-Fe(II) oxygenase [Komarekiella sp. 'clone 1']|uniref:2OG-Fe(II) oxygenase n=1 Tax=Komarekiella delphini-convector SJRDD-AB1 TaxID=2593771 RepID=A0AA40T3W8_9NOST|nr:2OG-Fe(II) oxygenase [Komarekiella delphini-convector]MBD6620210.1 2OG-Fe(II) oxygenase [Komarekiella delphini-convector SJRDD-AB1]
MKAIIKKAGNRILENLYRIPLLSNTADLAYQAAMTKHVDTLPILSNTDLSLVETLKAEGIIVTSLASLSITSTPQMLESAKSLMLDIPKSISKNKNEFIIHATSEQMMEHLEIFLWGLQQRLLNIIETYLGLPVAYHGSYFRRDIANQVQKKSRLWHLDKEDRKVLKIIIYLNEVNDDGGPFQYIPQSFSTKITRSLRYNYGYIQDKTMQQVISPLNWKSCTGPSGTVIIADTANIFHRGKIPIYSDRFTIFFDYTSRKPKHPFYCQSSLNRESLQIIAPKVSENQRRCIFWR